MQTATAETRVDRDREFDQTAKTDTQSDATRCYCSTDYGAHTAADHGRFRETEPTPEDFARPMPAVIEQHNARLAKPHDPTYLHTVLQRLWMNAVGTPDYDKANWNLLVELIGELSDELADTKKHRDHLKAMVTDRDTRIQQFEKFAQNLAEKIDEINADCIFLTGKSFDEHLADLNRERAGRRIDAPSGLCRSPSPASPGLVCLLDKDHGGPCSTNPQPPHVEELDVTKPCQFVAWTTNVRRQCVLIDGHSGDHMF